MISELFCSLQVRRDAEQQLSHAEKVTHSLSQVKIQNLHFYFIFISHIWKRNTDSSNKNDFCFHNLIKVQIFPKGSKIEIGAQIIIIFIIIIIIFFFPWFVSHKPQIVQYGVWSKLFKS